MPALILFTTVVTLFSAQSARADAARYCPGSPLNGSNQLVVSLTSSWESTSARIQRFERTTQGWQAVDAVPFEAVVGKNGLGWGLGIHEVEHSPAVKKEGDGKAPAGAFLLVEGFGYHPTVDLDLKAAKPLAYTQVTAHSRCVDDVKSSYYNLMIYDETDRRIKKDWDSFEELRRKDNLYEFAVVVAHNSRQNAGAGSCIFMHVWRGAGQGTAGCTAMDVSRVQELLVWLDETAKPVLVQLPAAEYENKKEAWCLP